MLAKITLDNCCFSNQQKCRPYFQEFMFIITWQMGNWIGPLIQQFFFFPSPQSQLVWLLLPALNNGLYAYINSLLFLLSWKWWFFWFVSVEIGNSPSVHHYNHSWPSYYAILFNWKWSLVTLKYLVLGRRLAIKTGAFIEALRKIQLILSCSYKQWIILNHLSQSRVRTAFIWLWWHKHVKDYRSI